MPNSYWLLVVSMMSSTTSLQSSSIYTIDNPNSPSQDITSLDPNASHSEGVGKYSNVFVDALTKWLWTFWIYIPILKHCWSPNSVASILHFTHPSNGGCHRTSCWLLRWCFANCVGRELRAIAIKNLASFAQLIREAGTWSPIL